MTTREFTILLVSDDASLRAAARQELETIDGRRRVASVSSLDAARRIVQDSVPAVILLTEPTNSSSEQKSRSGTPRLNAEVSSLARYAPVVVIGDAAHQNEFSELIAAGAADYVVRTAQCLNVALGLVERRLRQAPNEISMFAGAADPQPTGRIETFPDIDAQDFGEVLRHELNNPLTGILGNAELLLSEIRRKGDSLLPQGAVQRLETIATLAVRLRETVRRLSQEWESRQHPVHSP